ncbi:hypothetical protein Tco_1029098 [Tanacetum coccineum]|uniref:Uncharacterized protein n=1 Tax=Tanacetum coccineum TaxID=301880 RepID=A0ABQ5G2I1_9ASTR
MITDEMKLTEPYKKYVEVFGLDVPLTQSQPTKSTQGTHRTPSAPSIRPDLACSRITPLFQCPSAEERKKADEMMFTRHDSSKSWEQKSVKKSSKRKYGMVRALGSEEIEEFVKILE